MKRIPRTPAIDARISRAIVGLQIPLLSIVALHNKLLKAVADGAADHQLRQLAVDLLAPPHRHVGLGHCDVCGHYGRDCVGTP